MNYLSTRDRALRVSSAEAVKLGLSRDGGLLTPEAIPHFWTALANAPIRSARPGSWPST